MSGYSKDKRIDEYIAGLPGWQQIICQKVRDLVHQADAEVTETIKRTNRPYFELQGNICALQATKDHINVFIYDPIAADPDSIINQGQNNATARSIQIYETNTLSEGSLVTLFKAVIAHNRAGGWRKIKI